MRSGIHPVSDANKEERETCHDGGGRPTLHDKNREGKDETQKPHDERGPAISFRMCMVGRERKRMLHRFRDAILVHESPMGAGWLDALAPELSSVPSPCSKS
jgi:hypothetical protein